MEPRISLITLGVDDLPRARAFYEVLGFGDARQPDDEVVFFPARGMVLGLWRRPELEADSGSRTATGSAASRSRTTCAPAPRSTR